MGADVTVRGRALLDARFIQLGRRIAGVRKASRRTYRRVGLAAMVELWSYCTERGITEVDGEEVNDLLDHDEAASAIVDSELADQNGAAIRLRGADKLTWLKDRRTNASKGGAARSKSAKRAKDGTYAPAETENRVVESTPAESSPSISISTSINSKTRQEVVATPPARSKRARSKPPPGYREFVSHFDGLYSTAYGSKPTWGAKQGAMVKRLLKDHGLDECRRRCSIMFEQPPDWLSPPFDLGTLVQHFDKFSAVVSRRRDPSAEFVTSDDLTRLQRELEEQGL